MKARTSGAHGAATLARDSQPQKGNPLVQTSKQAFHYSVKKRKPYFLHITLPAAKTCFTSLFRK